MSLTPQHADGGVADRDLGRRDADDRCRRRTEIAAAVEHAGVVPGGEPPGDGGQRPVGQVGVVDVVGLHDQVVVGQVEHAAGSWSVAGCRSREPSVITIDPSWATRARPPGWMVNDERSCDPSR